MAPTHTYAERATHAQLVLLVGSFVHVNVCGKVRHYTMNTSAVTAIVMLVQLKDSIVIVVHSSCTHTECVSNRIRLNGKQSLTQCIYCEWIECAKKTGAIDLYFLSIHYSVQQQCYTHSHHQMVKLLPGSIAICFRFQFRSQLKLKMKRGAQPKKDKFKEYNFNCRSRKIHRFTQF